MCFRGFQRTLDHLNIRTNQYKHLQVFVLKALVLHTLYNRHSGSFYTGRLVQRGSNLFSSMSQDSNSGILVSRETTMLVFGLEPPQYGGCLGGPRPVKLLSYNVSTTFKL